MTQTEALKLALEALERGETELRWKAINAIREALAQPEQEPVATWENKYGMKEWQVHALRAGWSPTPPHRKPLSSVELVKIELSLRKYHDYDRYDLSLHDFARAIEAAHGIKE